MNVRLELSLRFRSARMAGIVAQSVGVDNEDYLAMKVAGRRIEAEIETATIGRALNTADDLLAAVTVAQRTAAASRDAAPSPTKKRHAAMGTGKPGEAADRKQKSRRR